MPLKTFNLLRCFAPSREIYLSNRGDGFEVEDGGSRFVRFFKIEGEVERPVVEVVGVNEGLVDGEAVFGEVGVTGVAGFGIEADLAAGRVVGVKLLEEALVRPEFAVAVVMGDEAERGLGVVAGERGDEGEYVVAEVALEGGFILGIGDLLFKFCELAFGGERGRNTCGRDAHTP